MDAFGANVKAQGEYLASHTILETLLHMSTDERAAREVGNLTRLVDSPDERVLVVFGAGHLGWLRQAVSSDPTLRLRTLAEFVK